MRKTILWLAFLLAMIPLSAQRHITGSVTDGAGAPLIGATVLLKDSSKGTVTDMEGNYELDVPEEATHLIFSYTGFATQQLGLWNKSELSAVLTESTTLLDEVMVVGYGTQVRNNITGNIAKVKAKEIENTPVTSLESAIQGRAAGVVVSQQNGKLGQAINIRIRGTASINANVEPLYVIDGIVMTTESQATNIAKTNPLADLNFNDIESIEILKDAAAAAIYGSRASNGVIIISTKKGQTNSLKLNLDISNGWSSPTRKREWLNADQYLELWDEAFANVADPDGTLFGLSGQDWKNIYIPGWDGGFDTNWENEIYNEDAGMQQVQLSVSGGNTKTTYYISGGLLDQTGILTVNEFDRLSGRLNLSHKASDQLDFGMNMSLMRTQNNRVPNDNQFSTPLQLIALPSVQPLYDPENPDELFNNTVYFNGKLVPGNGTLLTTVFRTLGNTFLNWKPLPNLTVHTDFGIDVLNQDEDLYLNTKVARDTQEPNGFGSSSFSRAVNYSTNNYLTYDWNRIGHHITVTGGMSFQSYERSYNNVEGRNFPNDDFQNLASAGEISGGTEVETAYSIVSYFGRANYSFDNKYLFSVAARQDGDSRFGRANRYGFFPAVSAGWVISKEGFLNNNSKLSYLKLRASWGLTGNTPINNFGSLGLFGGTRYAGGAGIIQTQVANPNLKWEKTQQIDVGLDFGLFNDRISGQVDYYVKNTEDLLLNVNVPSTSGFLSQMQNIGSLENRGFEVVLNTYNTTGKFKWKTSINFSKNENLVTDIQEQVIEGGFANRAIEGHPIGVFFLPEYAGVDPENGDALYFLNTGTEDGAPGDRSTTNNVNEAERVVVGSPHPDFTYGINNTFSYKGLELSVLFQGVVGNEIMNGGGVFQMDGFGWFDNQDIRALNRWQNPGDITDFPQLRFLAGTTESSRFIEDGTYLRLKNLSLGYDLPQSIIQKIGLNTLKIYVVGQNLWTLTDYQGWDPEVNTDANTNNISLGTDFYSAPQAKTFVVGIKAGF